MTKVHYAKPAIGRCLAKGDPLVTACGMGGIVDDETEFTRTDNGIENRCDYTVELSRVNCRRCLGSRVVLHDRIAIKP